MITLFYDEYPCDHYKKEIEKADIDLENHHMGPVRRLTGSEHYILRILQAVRCGILRTDEIKIYCYGKPIDIDVKGEEGTAFLQKATTALSGQRYSFL